MGTLLLYTGITISYALRAGFSDEEIKQISVNVFRSRSTSILFSRFSVPGVFKIHSHVTLNLIMYIFPILSSP